jgi:hypothetical protein
MTIAPTPVDITDAYVDPDAPVRVAARSAAETA